MFIRQKLVEFKPPPKNGESLYNKYREERVRQGWEEFLWGNLSITQQLVWHRVAERVKNEFTVK